MSEREKIILAMYGESEDDFLKVEETGEYIFGFTFYDQNKKAIPRSKLPDKAIIRYYDVEVVV